MKSSEAMILALMNAIFAIALHVLEKPEFFRPLYKSLDFISAVQYMIYFIYHFIIDSSFKETLQKHK